MKVMLIKNKAKKECKNLLYHKTNYNKIAKLEIKAKKYNNQANNYFKPNINKENKSINYKFL